jgi:hypothetical protein
MIHEKGGSCSRKRRHVSCSPIVFSQLVFFWRETTSAENVNFFPPKLNSFRNCFALIDFTRKSHHRSADVPILRNKNQSLQILSKEQEKALALWLSEA